MFKLDEFLADAEGLEVEKKDGTVKHFEKVDGKWNLYAIEDGNEIYILSDIPNFSAYKADIERGMIYSLVSDRWLNPKTPNRFGYLFTTLKDNYGNAVPMSVHSIMMSAHLQKPVKHYLSQGLEVNHIDFDKTNNNIENLELVTHKEQFCDVVRSRMGRGTRLSDGEVQYIKYVAAVAKAKEQYAINKLSNYFAQKFGKDYVTIFNILKGNTYKNVELNEVMKKEVRKIELEHDLARLSEIA